MVPQFIDVESKVVGKITIHQFIIMIIWGLFLFIFWKAFDIAAFILIGLPWTIIMGLFGFYKVNGRPFHIFIAIVAKGRKRPNLRVWRNEVSAVDIQNKKKAKERHIISSAARPKVLRSRLSELALVVDTGGMYEGELTQRSKRKDQN